MQPLSLEVFKNRIDFHVWFKSGTAQRWRKAEVLYFMPHIYCEDLLKSILSFQILETEVFCYNMASWILKNILLPPVNFIYICMYVCMYVYILLCLKIFISFPWKVRISKHINSYPSSLFLLFWNIVFLVTCLHNKVQISSHRNLFWQALANQIYTI